MARVQLNVWVEAHERDAIKAEAARRGLSVGRFLAQAALGERKRRSADDRLDVLEQRVAALEGEDEGLDRRLSRIEEMASGQY